MSGKQIVAGAFLGLILSVGVMYYALPFMYPQQGAIQVKTTTFDSSAFIFDTMKGSWIEMNDTEMDITTRGNTALSVNFQANLVMQLFPNFQGRFSVNISLVVAGVGYWNTTILYVSNDAFSGTQYLQTSNNVNINYMTGTLSAGTYRIAVYWISTSSTSSGSNYLSASHTGYNRTRSLTAIEYA
jgi:hypothetical protein